MDVQVRRIGTSLQDDGIFRIPKGMIFVSHIIN